MKTFIVMMGPPGAGKGTQSKLLQAKLGLPQVSTGDLFRYNLKNETELGILAKSYMDKGELVPDEVTVDMVRDRVSNEDAQSGAILDGFPRTAAQADALNELLSQLGGEIRVVPFINVPDEILIARLLKRAEQEGRADDNEETIRTRMSVYRTETAPLLDYYQERDLLVEIDGDRTVDEVQSDLLSVIGDVE